MKKRVLAGLMMTVMVLASAMSVSAAPSKQVTVETGTSEGKYEVTVDQKVDDYEELTDAAIDANEKITDKEAAKKSAKEAKEIIAAVNEGKTVSITTDVDKAIKGKKLVQKFFDLDEIGAVHEDCHKQGFHPVTLKLDGLTKAWKNITIVHYSTDRTLWETISGDDIKVDYDKKTISFQIKDLSPLAIYADIVEDNAVGKAPTTEGVSSAWMLYTAMALIVLGTGVVVYQKKRG